MKNIVKTVITAMAVISGLCIYTANRIPGIISVSYGQQVYIESMPAVTLKPLGEKAADRPISTADSPLYYQASLLGLFPVKEVAVVQDHRRYVNVSGRPFGIKMFCDGVMVVGFSDILTQSGYKNPAKLAGLKLGDIITHINGRETQTNEDVEQIIEKSENNPIKITFIRDDAEHTALLVAVKDVNTDSYRTGMWVRDSGAGIGTMTFYEPEMGYFSGLGHGIKDVDTQQELRLLSGEIVPVKITGIVKSKNGSAGQLKGAFLTTIASGKILYNGATGVCGKVYSVDTDNLMAVANPTEIQAGKAYILTTIAGTQPQQYEIEIEKINLTSSDRNKNMVIRVTDSRLLALTGGIVAGFSGSPIVQNGKLVGAVTHVFVNQVDKGYGIFATNMLETLDSVATKRGDMAA